MFHLRSFFNVSNYKKVAPFFRYDQKKGVIHMVSTAGHIKLKCKENGDIERYRNEYLNVFSYIDSPNYKNKGMFGNISKKRAYSKLYRVIRRKEKWLKVSFRGNIKTWLIYRFGI